MDEKIVSDCAKKTFTLPANGSFFDFAPDSPAEKGTKNLPPVLHPVRLRAGIGVLCDVPHPDIHHWTAILTEGKGCNETENQSALERPAGS